MPDRARDNQIDLFTVQADSGALRRLTATKTWEERAEWSADAQRLAYALSAPSGEPTEIATMNAAGGDVRVVTRFGSASNAPTWSPDGRLAYFSLHDFPTPSRNGPLHPAELYSIAGDGSGEQRLTRDKSIQTDAPNGRRTGRRSPTRSGTPCAASRACSISGCRS